MPGPSDPLSIVWRTRDEGGYTSLIVSFSLPEEDDTINKIIAIDEDIENNATVDYVVKDILVNSEATAKIMSKIEGRKYKIKRV